jgi:(R,R)-butanediol dehydrogenase/meso-butanediol dehydrogenase/diacetyl reductase
VGLHRHGALAEYVVTPPENCLSVADTGLTLDEAALCQPMSIAVHNVSRAGDVSGQVVVVLGVGGIGTFLVYALAETGAQVLAADVDPERLELAAELGAQRTVLVTGSPADPTLLRGVGSPRRSTWLRAAAASCWSASRRRPSRSTSAR